MVLLANCVRVEPTDVTRPEPAVGGELLARLFGIVGGLDRRLLLVGLAHRQLADRQVACRGPSIQARHVNHQRWNRCIRWLVSDDLRELHERVESRFSFTFQLGKIQAVDDLERVLSRQVLVIVRVDVVRAGRDSLELAGLDHRIDAERLIVEPIDQDQGIQRSHFGIAVHIIISRQDACCLGDFPSVTGRLGHL